MNDERTFYTLTEICQQCDVTGSYVVELVDYGVLSPEPTQRSEWLFTSHTILRIKKAQRLQHDLDLNLAGVALSLELLDDMDGLRNEINHLRHQLTQLER